VFGRSASIAANATSLTSASLPTPPSSSVARFCASLLEYEEFDLRQKEEMAELEEVIAQSLVLEKERVRLVDGGGAGGEDEAGIDDEDEDDRDAPRGSAAASSSSSSSGGGGSSSSSSRRRASAKDDDDGDVDRTRERRRTSPTRRTPSSGGRCVTLIFSFITLLNSSLI
jgi:hypothetical protein